MFVCTVDPDFSQAEVLRDGARWLVIIPVGYDDEDDRSFSLFVSLEPEAGAGADELSFCLIELDGETDSEYLIWSGRETAHAIPAADREKILGQLLRSVQALVRVAQSQRIVMCTTEANLPDKAVRKFVAIARAIEMCGYAVRQPDPYHGKRIWWMERHPPVGS